MANELKIREQLDSLLSLPPRLAGLAKSLGRTNWSGEPTRWNFPPGQDLTPHERQDLQGRCAALETALAGSNLTAEQAWKATLALLTKLVDGYPIGQMSDSAAYSRLEHYEYALEGIPPWVVNQARRRWARGEVPATVRKPNFAFAPSPTELRAICLNVMEFYQASLANMRMLLAAVSADRAMDPTPLPAPPNGEALEGNDVLPMLRRM